MQLTVNEAQNAKTIKDAAVSIPKSFYTGKILGKEIELDTCISNDSLGTALINSLQHQHPLINAWLILSSVSICFLSALFFVIPK